MPAKYDKDTKAKARRPVAEYADEYASQWEAIKTVSGRLATPATVSTIRGLPDRSLTLAYDWPWCLGVDLSAPVRQRSTHTPAGREGGDRIGA